MSLLDWTTCAWLIICQKFLIYRLKTVRVGRSGMRSNTQVKRCANELESCHWPPTRCWLSSAYWFFCSDKLFLLWPRHDLPSSSFSRSLSYLLRFSPTFSPPVSTGSTMTCLWWRGCQASKKAADSVLGTDSVFSLGSPGGQLDSQQYTAEVIKGDTLNPDL